MERAVEDFGKRNSVNYVVNENGQPKLYHVNLLKNTTVVTTTRVGPATSEPTPQDQHSGTMLLMLSSKKKNTTAASYLSFMLTLEKKRAVWI